MFESLAENKEVWSAFKDAYRVRRDLSKYLGTFYYRWWFLFMLRMGEPWLSIKAVRSVRYLKNKYQYHRLAVYHKQKSLWSYWLMKGEEDVCLKIPDKWVIPVLIEMYLDYTKSFEVRFDEYVTKLRNRGELFVEDVRKKSNFNDIVRKLCQYRSFQVKS